MLIIDLEMPDRCETCPCVHLIDREENGDYCQINFNDLTLEQIERKRPEWCPLINCPLMNATDEEAIKKIQKELDIKSPSKIAEEYARKGLEEGIKELEERGIKFGN